jgi:hypothetical protein
MCNSRPCQVHKYAAIGAMVSILLGTITVIANGSFTQTSNLGEPQSAEHNAAESLPELGFFASRASQSELACSEGSGRVCSVLFVGDSFTHGRYKSVRTYNSDTL